MIKKVEDGELGKYEIDTFGLGYDVKMYFKHCRKYTGSAFLENEILLKISSLEGWFGVSLLDAWRMVITMTIKAIFRKGMQ